jgi:hypothetical protein
LNKRLLQEISSTEATDAGGNQQEYVSTLKTLSPQYLSDTAATPVSPLTTLIGIDTENSCRSSGEQQVTAAIVVVACIFREWLGFEDLTVSVERR